MAGAELITSLLAHDQSDMHETKGKKSRNEFAREKRKKSTEIHC